MKKWFLALTAALLLAAAPVLAQGQLSVQVLQLLTRVNTWVGTQTFQDIRLPSPCAAIPSVTAGRIYTDASCNLYFNGGLIAGSGGGVTPHNLLSTTHADTLASTPVRGGVIVANSTPAWAQLALGATGNFLRSNGTDAVWGTDAGSLTNIPAANLTGTIAAISGVNLTNLNASNLASGTVPLARLSGITTTQISGTAAITYSQLTLTNGIVNADINSSAAIAYSKLNLATSILNTDIAATTITFAKWATNSCTNLQVPQFNGTSWVCKSLVTSDVSGAGTVSSVALSMPAQFAVAGSPITTSGTLAVTLANQSANLVFAGPSTGAANAPTFRSLVNADFPTSGVTAGTYSKVTVNAQGIVTVGATASLTADVSGILPVANGGTNLSTAANHAAMVGDGTTWQSRTLPDCTSGALAFTQATNLFSCQSGGVAHNLLSSTHSDTLAASPVRGDVIVANSTPAWSRLALGVAPNVLMTSNGTDAVWSNTITMGTVTTNNPLSITQTWNAAVTFTAAKVNVTDTSSNAASLLLDLQKGGSSQFSVVKNGSWNSLGNLVYSAAAPTISSGFGTSPAISGKVHAFKITIGNPAATSGVVAFNDTFVNAPVCIVNDETITNGAFGLGAATPTTTQVTITVPSAKAGEVYSVHCDGF